MGPSMAKLRVHGSTKSRGENSQTSAQHRCPTLPRRDGSSRPAFPIRWGSIFNVLHMVHRLIIENGWSLSRTACYPKHGMSRVKSSFLSRRPWRRSVMSQIQRYEPLGRHTGCRLALEGLCKPDVSKQKPLRSVVR